MVTRFLVKAGNQGYRWGIDNRAAGTVKLTKLTRKRC